jgi:N-acetylmuramoyl-L-alanine amidase
MKKLLSLVFFLTSLTTAQYSIPVIFTQDSSKDAEIGTFTRKGILYGSLPDLLTAFHLKYYVDTEVRKVQFATARYSVKVTAHNPFIIIGDQNNTATVLQIPFDIRFAANTFFVPLEFFIPFFDGLMPENIAFDSKEMIVRVGTLKPRLLFDITGLSFEEKTNGYLMNIHCTKKLKDYDSWKKADREYTWLYVTLADAKADSAAITAVKKPSFVKDILVFQSPTSVQLTVKLKGKIENIDLLPSAENDNILVNAYFPKEKPLTVSPAVKNLESALEKERNRWKLDCIVIDAGHGGDDPGTIGVARTREKDVTLAIALKLNKLIEKNLPNVRTVLTRTTDEFVELDRRGQIANQAGGKLFLSIHCNSAPRKPHPANGFEIYLLRPGKTEAALRIAERENAVIKFEKDYERRYQQLTEENFILLTMAQSAYVKYSEQFADILQREMDKHLDLENNGVKQAGFYVLVGASMPNVLIETGYLSNKKEEQFLKSPQGQQKIAEAIFNAIKRYKQEYEKNFDEEKERGN